MQALFALIYAQHIAPLLAELAHLESANPEALKALLPDAEALFADFIALSTSASKFASVLAIVRDAAKLIEDIRAAKAAQPA